MHKNKGFTKKINKADTSYMKSVRNIIPEKKIYLESELNIVTQARKHKE